MENTFPHGVFPEPNSVHPGPCTEEQIWIFISPPHCQQAVFMQAVGVFAAPQVSHIVAHGHDGVTLHVQLLTGTPGFSWQFPRPPTMRAISLCSSTRALGAPAVEAQAVTATAIRAKDEISHRGFMVQPPDRVSSFSRREILTCQFSVGGKRGQANFSLMNFLFTARLAAHRARRVLCHFLPLAHGDAVVHLPAGIRSRQPAPFVYRGNPPRGRHPVYGIG